MLLNHYNLFWRIEQWETRLIWNIIIVVAVENMFRQKMVFMVLLIGKMVVCSESIAIKPVVNLPKE